MASSFRWIVDNELLRKHNLICPEDYITEKLPLAKAPKGNQSNLDFLEHSVIEVLEDVADLSIFL